MTLSPGTRLGPYEVVAPLGAGGMGEVYRAKDTRLDRIVAIKVLPADLASETDPRREPGRMAAGSGPSRAKSREERQARFEREAKTIAALNHPHICTLYDVGSTPSTGSGQASSPQAAEPPVLYLVMEYLSGETLAQRLVKGALPVEETLSVATEIADALEAAHGQGVIHRDLKPGNVMLTKAGAAREGSLQAKLLDFGLATLAAEPHTASEAPTAAGRWVTEAGLALGTVGYMSPEQVRGEALDARTDLFSLGVVLYEMATGTAPFRGATSGAVLSEILTSAPTSPARLNPEVPADLERLINRLLEKDRALRYQSAADLRVDLERLHRALSDTPAARSAHASIVVLPFANISSDPEQEYFSDGLTEEVIATLSKLPSLRVISRNSAMTLKGAKKTTREIAQLLNVSHVLEGSVRKAGVNLRITAQLIDAKSDAHLWAEQYSGTLDDVFAIQAEVAGRIAEALGATLTPAERGRLERRPTDDVEAHNLYLLGRHFWDRWTEEDIRKSVELFERAIERDPKFALAHCGLGLAWTTLALGYFSDRPVETYPVARRALTRALALDPEMAEAHSWLALIEAWCDFDWSSAGKRHQDALRLDPNSAQAHDAYGWWLTAHGRHPEAARESEQAYRLDPLSGVVVVNAAMGAYRARDYGRALSWFDRAIVLDPNLQMAYGLSALVHVQQHDTARARQASQRALELGAGLAGKALHAYVSAASGDVARARALLSQLEQRRATENIWLFVLAMAYAELGEHALAFARLEEAIQQRGGWVAWLAVEPGLDPLRADPRFPPMLESVGLG